jgi:uncharacterized Zn finger protein (UPF0148 family)
MKVCEICQQEIWTTDGDNLCPSCDRRERRRVARRRYRREKRSAMDAIMRGLGMVKVRGSLGGVYWE